MFNIRFNDCWTSAKLERWLRQRLDEVGGRYALDISVSGEAFVVAPGRLSDCLAEAIRRVTGRTPELSTTGGTSDARFIRAHCPVAEFGLVGLTMHKVDERVELSDLAALTAIYHTFLDLFFDHPSCEPRPHDHSASGHPLLRHTPSAGRPEMRVSRWMTSWISGSAHPRGRLAPSGRAPRSVP